MKQLYTITESQTLNRREFECAEHNTTTTTNRGSVALACDRGHALISSLVIAHVLAVSQEREGERERAAGKGKRIGLGGAGVRTIDCHIGIALHDAATCFGRHRHKSLRQRIYIDWPTGGFRARATGACART